MNKTEILRELLPETVPANISSLSEIRRDIINTLSENQFTISETRYLFNSILSQFEESMPVTNHTK